MMDLEEIRYSVLIVSSAEKFSRSFAEMLPDNRYSPVTMTTSAGSARRMLLERSFDIAVINAPLSDEFGARLATDICTESSTGVLLLVRAEHYPDISAHVMASGVLTMAKPTSTQMLLQSMLLLCGTRERLRQMERKTASIEEKMEEIRLVNRAKWLLIEQLGMSETEAHRYIEKQAMDRCVTRRAIAENLIAAYR